jgi:hypothetical protein
MLTVKGIIEGQLILTYIFADRSRRENAVTDGCVTVSQEEQGKIEKYGSSC